MKETGGKAKHFKEGLELLGFESIFVSRGMGSVFLWIIMVTVSLFMIVLLIPFRQKFQCAQSLSDRLSEKFLWNPILRTIM